MVPCGVEGFGHYHIFLRCPSNLLSIFIYVPINNKAVYICFLRIYKYINININIHIHIYIYIYIYIYITHIGTSLVVQWLRICLPMQGTRVRALVREDPTCCGATKPMRHNY